jgi:hypothetical protein
MAINYDNERKYLNSLIQQGGGKGEWAKQQAKKYAQQYEGFSLNAPTPTPQARAQPSHQAWINNPQSGQGGMDAYTQRQNQRYQEASATGNQDLLNRLRADSQRVGYSLNDTAPKTQTRVSSSSNRNYIDELMNARRNQQMTQLGKSKDEALSNLGQERAGIAPRYYDQRNMVAAGNQQASRNFAEFMQARGSTNAGSNAQAQLTQNMALQGNIGSLNRQEAQANDNVDRRISDTKNAYQSDLVSLEQGLQSERLQALINQHNADRQFNLQEGGLMGSYNGQQTLAGQQLQYGQQRDNVMDQRYDQQFNYQQTRDQIGDQRYQQQFDEDVRRFGIQSALDRQVKLGSLSMQQAQLALSQAKYNDGLQQSQDENEQTKFYNEFLEDLPRFNTLNEAEAVIQSLINDGASPELVTQMRKEIAKRNLTIEPSGTNVPTWKY